VAVINPWKKSSGKTYATDKIDASLGKKCVTARETGVLMIDLSNVPESQPTLLDGCFPLLQTEVAPNKIAENARFG
jgi:hypothetical protein